MTMLLHPVWVGSSVPLLGNVVVGFVDYVEEMFNGDRGPQTSVRVYRVARNFVPASGSMCRVYCASGD